MNDGVEVGTDECSKHVSAAPSERETCVSPVSRPVRRSPRKLTAAYKLALLKEAAECSTRASLTALLQRERITAAQLGTWRRRVELHGSEGLLRAKPGRKATVGPVHTKIRALERRIAGLERELGLARRLIELQQGAIAEDAASPFVVRQTRMLAVLEQFGRRVPVTRACRALGVSRATFYRRASSSKT